VGLNYAHESWAPTGPEGVGHSHRSKKERELDLGSSGIEKKALVHFKVRDQKKERHGVMGEGRSGGGRPLLVIRGSLFAEGRNGLG